MRLIIGVDEAGRGPLAGPITLSVFAAPQRLKNKLIKILGGPTSRRLRGTNQIKDSKQLSPTKRYSIYSKFLKLKKEEIIFFSVSHVSHKIIDKKGISYATKLGIKRCLNKLKIVNSLKIINCKLKILLDGSLKAPPEYNNQETIIGGDSSNIFIACASIVAKVRRDRLMCRLSYKFPLYAFEIHKGYGTALHYKLLKKHGPSEAHRKSFLKNFCH